MNFGIIGRESVHKFGDGSVVLATSIGTVILRIDDFENRVKERSLYPWSTFACFLIKYFLTKK